MAYTESKAPIVHKAIEFEISPMVPASYLQQHKSCEFILDKPSASFLTRYRAPWTIKGI